MRTPLTSILGYCDLLRIKGDLDPKAQDFVEVIKDNGQRLLDLVNNLLDVSRIEAGRMTLSQEPTELDELVVHAVRMIGPLAEQKHIKVETELAEETPRVFVDTKKISQVLINLLSNAVKYTPDTGEVTVSTALADTGDMVQVDVADTGIGIPASELPTIFDRFSRVDSEETRDTVGTGLGLTITKGFVEGHGGDIWVESEEGVGSVFHFTLPTYQGQASETTQ
jgi:signal transduction histidine kinase